MPNTLNPYHIAITKIPILGPKTIRQLMEICKTPEALFSMSEAQLKEIFSTRKSIIETILAKNVLRQAEAEIKQLQQYNIETLFFTDPEYPQRLNNQGCEDTPTLLYRLGSCNLNPAHSVAMVGSRKCTDYGRTTTVQLVQDMASDKPLIVSGLAYGIDTAAHTAAVDNNIPTVAVLGHGLDIIYPNQNRPLAKRILESGGALITEYPLNTPINPSYFPARNRIVAALSDATVVVEAAKRGGALITANIANSYFREVFAVPGRINDLTSEGCNNLIANNKAIIIRNAGDIFFQMGWKTPNGTNKRKEEQLSLFATLTPDEQVITNLLQEHHELTIDEFEKYCQFSLPKIASLLMNLELKKAIRCLPGRLYKLC